MTTDPGWRPVLRRLPFLLNPVTARRDRLSKFDGLTVLRGVYLSFLIALILITVVLQFLDFDGDGEWTVTSSLLVLATAAVVGWAAAAWSWRRPLTGTTPQEAAGSYRTSMFRLIAFSESLPLLGYTLVFLADSLTPYYAGLVLGLPGMLLAAPTARDIARRQEQLPYDVDLLAGLIEPASKP